MFRELGDRSAEVRVWQQLHFSFDSSTLWVRRPLMPKLKFTAALCQADSLLQLTVAHLEANRHSNSRFPDASVCKADCEEEACAAAKRAPKP